MSNPYEDNQNGRDFGDFDFLAQKSDEFLPDFADEYFMWDDNDEESEFGRTMKCSCGRFPNVGRSQTEDEGSIDGYKHVCHCIMCDANNGVAPTFYPTMEEAMHAWQKKRNAEEAQK